MEKKEYFIGLDMGTSSVGWAVTDTNYNLLRAKGKDMWGVRLFSEASTAADRRGYRISRRNLKRKKVREAYLREIFEDEINKVDPSFFERLKESFYYLEDKTNKVPFVLFADNGYTDKEYYDDYPTIFHLINELVDDEKGARPHDVRFVYLACLNIFKHRGHFLNDGLSGDGIDKIENLCDLLVNSIHECNENTELDEKVEKYEFNKEELILCLESVLCDKNLSASAKKREIINRLGISNKSKYIIEMISLICGLTATVSNIFAKEEYDEEQKKQKLCFKSSTLEEDLPKVGEMLSNEEYDIILLLKRIHDYSVVSIIMGSHNYISEARIALYDKHKADLKELKEIYKTYAKDKYDDMFREMSENSYSAYVGKVSSDKFSQTGNYKTRMKRRGAKCKREDFYARIKKELGSLSEEITKNVFEQIDAGTFLPKQLTNENGVIPYQLHMSELEKLLKNASKYLDFLNEKDDTGLSNKEKIIELFKFRIPYYVGPLYKEERIKTNAWVIRKENGKVLPWNYEEKIDKKQSAEIFIERMVRHCTYLNDETALPKNSLLYEKFRVLNELNNLKINGERVSVDLKQDIYNKLFKVSKKRVSKAMLIKFLREHGYADKDVEVSGFDGTFANALLTYGKFRDVFETDVLTDSQIKAVEDVVKWSTVYGDSKKFLEEKINENYGPTSDNKIFTEKQIKRVLGYKFKDWGQLSKEFLYLEGADKDTGEILPIISRMWNENLNLMELLSGRFTYREALSERINNIEKGLDEIEYDDLENLYISAPVRRMTWQALLILKEIYGIMGCAPKKIFVEMARSEEEKGVRKSSRKKRLEELYKNCKEETELIRGLKNRDEGELRGKKLYLYYMQKGRCMYSGDAINIASLFTNDYDIDHIYPQSVVKDDSLDNNMVLVKRNYNNIKSDTYPLSRDWQQSMKTFWDGLNKQGFLNDEKYKRLTRKEELTNEELANFVNRQLVETRQATKVIAELLKVSFDDKCDIVYAKAGNVSDFRHKFSMKYDKETGASTVIAPELVKCREINDFHHANDAYLNIVVGNVYDVKFTKDPRKYIEEYKKQNIVKGSKEIEKYHMNKIFDFDVARNGEVAWNRFDKEKEKSLEIVKRVMRKNTPIVTRMSFEGTGGISNQTIWSAEKASKGVGYISVKPTNSRLDYKRYGGFSTLTTAYFFLVEHTVKGERVRTIEAMPLYLKDKLQTKEKMEIWCADKESGLGLVEPDVRWKKIKLCSKISINGFDLYLTGKQGNSLFTCNGVQFKIDGYWKYYIKKLYSYSEKESDCINEVDNMGLYDILLDRCSKGIYSKRQSPIGQKLICGKEKFVVLSLDEQVEALLGIMKVGAFENQGFDLHHIGGAKQSGKMVPNKKISGNESVYLINQSVTGMYENKVDLLKV